MVYDEVIKNYFGGVSDVFSSEKLVRMYKIFEKNDVYKVLKFYMVKFNFQCDVFFQYLRKNFKWNYYDEVWFDV